MEISQVVQTNAASAEECAAASEELTGHADCLKQNVSVFKLNTGSAMSVR
jgi:methyl-accepting chemotaxis protein